MTKNNTEFGEFLKDQVNLNPSRLERLKSSVRGVTDCLKRQLTGFQTTEPQGSYALGTIIKPVDDTDEYDVDIQVVMNPNPEMEPKDYIGEVRKALKADKNYADKVRLKTRCVTVDYAGDFHLDVVPRITDDGTHYIFNRIENEREETDGTGYREWFNDKNRITGGNLKRVVRLLKYLRDHKGNYTAKSIILTTLAANAIEESDEETEAVSTVADTLVTALTRMDEYLQENPQMPEIKNPVLPSETFNRHWDERKYANFRKMVNSHTRKARDAKNATKSEEAIKLWQDLFGDKFGKGSSGGGGKGNNSLPNPPNPSSGSQGQTITAAPSIVRPRKPYAGAQVSNQTIPNAVTMPVSNQDLELLRQKQPGLSYDAETNTIHGNLRFSAEYDTKNGDIAVWAEQVSDPVYKNPNMLIRDAFEIEIQLRFHPSQYNPWPDVIETAGRIQQIMDKRKIANLADMHCFQRDSGNACCLGFKAYSDDKIKVVDFIKEIVIPFFYRVAYVERHGLKAAQTNLWGEYPHGIEKTEPEYIGELRAMNKIGRNALCACGSNKKYKNCHLAEVTAAKKMDAFYPKRRGR